jgi:hypothetical protein
MPSAGEEAEKLLAGVKQKSDTDILCATALKSRAFIPDK